MNRNRSVVFIVLLVAFAACPSLFGCKRSSSESVEAESERQSAKLEHDEIPLASTTPPQARLTAPSETLPPVEVKDDRVPKTDVKVETSHYRLTLKGSEAEVRALGNELESYLVAYTRLIGRAPKGHPYRVRIFGSKDEFDSYLSRAGRGGSDGFRYFHFGIGNPKNEVLGWRVPEYPLHARLRHEAFHQYLRGSINKPPRWLNEGYGELLEALTIDAGVITPRLTRRKSSTFARRPAQNRQRFVERPPSRRDFVGATFFYVQGAVATRTLGRVRRVVGFGALHELDWKQDLRVEARRLHRFASDERDGGTELGGVRTSDWKI